MAAAAANGDGGRGRGRAAAPVARVPLTRAYLRRRYQRQGVSSDRIAADTGWSSQYVRDRLREHDIPLRRPGLAKPPLDRAVVTGWLEQGLAVEQIAARAGYSLSAIYTALRRWQLPTPTAGHRPAARSPEQTELLATVGRLYRDEQLSVAAVGARFGRGPDWARARLSAAGVQIRRGGTPRPPLDGAQLAAWYAGGLTVAQVAARVGRPVKPVGAALRAAGVQLRRGRPAPDPARARELYIGQCLTLAQVGTQLGCSAKRVRAALLAAGVELRPAGQPATGPALAPLTAELLRKLYVEDALTLDQVAARLGGSPFRIASALDRFGIARRRGGAPPAPAFALDRATLTRLYVRDRLDDAEIADRNQVPVFRVSQRRRALGITRALVQPADRRPPAPPPARRLRALYLDQGTPIAAIARQHHTSKIVVRGWLIAAGIPIRPRTARAHRRTLDARVLRELYTDREWTAAEIAVEFDTTTHRVLRELHANTIPVRRAGTRPRRHPPPATQLLAALYADPEIDAVLRRHHIPRRPQPGPIAAVPHRRPAHHDPPR